MNQAELDNTGAYLPITAEKGCDLSKVFDVFDDSGAPIDQSGYTGAITFHGDAGATFPIGTITCTGNQVALTVTKAQIDAMSVDRCYYRIHLTQAGVTEPFLKGDFKRVV